MNLADFDGAPAPEPAAHGSVSAQDEQTLVAQLGGEVAFTLSSALERVHQLVATGRIDRMGLSALREEIDRARRAAMTGQQVVRLAQGQVQLSLERLHLTTLVREALRQRGREIEARSVAVRQLLEPAEVLSDTTLVFSFLQTLFDWCFEHTVSRLDLQLQVQGWPPQARLQAGFFYRPVDETHMLVEEVLGAGGHGINDGGAQEALAASYGPPGAADRGPFDHAAVLNTMSWRLLVQMAAVLELSVQRQDRAGRTELTVQFPNTVAAQLTSVTDEVMWGGAQSQALARRQILVVAAKRELSNLIREALRPTGAQVDLVTDVAQATVWCESALPHAVVYEEAAAGEALEAWRRNLLNEAPGIAFLCIAEQGRAFELLNVSGRQVASVGRSGVIESLAAALVFELSRQA